MIHMVYDIIIIGGGPAGLSAAIYASRRALKVLIISKDIGGQAIYAAKVENYPGFESILGAELIEKMRNQAKKFGARIVDENVIKIDFSNQFPCSCGDYGCLEAFASSSALQKRTGITSKDLYEKAKKEDPEALALFKEMGKKLGRGIASVSNLLNIECFILGGRLSGAFPYFYPSAIDMAKHSSMKGPAEHLEILQSQLGDDAGMLGAAYRYLIL